MELRFAGIRIMREHMLLTVFPNLVLLELPYSQNFKIDRIIEIMAVICNLVGKIGDLRFQRWKPALTIVLLQTLANFKGQIQSRKIRIRVLQQLNDPQTLAIVLKPAVIAHALGENFFARMPEWRVTQIMGQGDRFRQILVK